MSSEFASQRFYGTPRGTNRRAGWLVLPVLAAHLVLLAPAQRVVQATPPRPVQFMTRSIAPAPAPLAPAPARVAMAPPAIPQTAAPPRPRPITPPMRRPARAPQPAASPASPPSPSPADPPIAIPPPVRLHYEVQAQVRGVPVTGEATLAWRHDGENYEATLEIAGANLPARTQRSTGRITPRGLAPGYFLDQGRGAQATHFDREQGRIVFSNNRPQAELAAGMQDRLSVVVQLSALLAGDPARYPPGTQVAVPTASTREAQTWVFDVEGEEDLQLPGGEVRALKLQRRPRGEYDQRLELWLAPRMAYAPARLRLTNPDGGAVDQRWVSTDRAGEPGHLK